MEELIVLLRQIIGTRQSSEPRVSLKRNREGGVEFEITTSNPNGLAAARDEAVSVYQELDAQFPHVGK